MLRRLSLTFLALAFTSVSLGQAQTTLRYQFKEGEVLPYEIVQKMNMSMAVMGKKIDMAMNQTLEMSWTVGKVSEAGAAQITIKFTRAAMEMDGPMGKTKIDTNDKNVPDDPLGGILDKVMRGLVQMELSGTMSNLGEMTEVKIPENSVKALKNLPGADQFGDMFSEEGLKRMMSQNGLVLPKDPVKKGDKWSQKVEAKLPFGKMTADMNYTYEGAEKDELQKIKVEPNTKITPDPNAAIALKFKSQSGDGIITFDNKKGRLVESNATINMNLSAEINNLQIEQNITQNIIMRLKAK